MLYLPQTILKNLLSLNSQHVIMDWSCKNGKVLIFEALSPSVPWEKWQRFFSLGTVKQNLHLIARMDSGLCTDPDKSIHWR